MSADTEMIDAFPKAWLRWARQAWTRTRTGFNHGDSRKSENGRTSTLLTRMRGRLVRGMRQYGQKLIADQFRTFCSRRSYDLYHEPNFIPLPFDGPTVTTVHDLSVLLHPEWHPAQRVAHFDRHFRRGVARCDHLLAISENGRQELMRTLHLPPERVTRTYMGVRRGLHPLPTTAVQPVLRRLGLPGRYLLHVGTIEPRKNLLRLMQAYCALPDALRFTYPLVLVGGWGWNARATADYYLHRARQRGVLWRGYVADEDLAAVYNGARALVFPTLYEGFGMPPLEMMACGGAVLASTAGAVAETAGGQAHLIDPLDVDGWREGMARVLSDDDWWLALRQGAVQKSQPFTWEQCAADTLRVYRSVCGAATRQDLLPGGVAGSRAA
jgi:alpha-1,3-rhamnosyl/mannosyltransferase